MKVYKIYAKGCTSSRPIEDVTYKEEEMVEMPFPKIGTMRQKMDLLSSRRILMATFHKKIMK